MKNSSTVHRLVPGSGAGAVVSCGVDQQHRAPPPPQQQQQLLVLAGPHSQGVWQTDAGHPRPTFVPIVLRRTSQALTSAALSPFSWLRPCTEPRNSPLPPSPQALMPVALFHTIGHIAAVVSFSQMAVSFAHIVKSAEPVFSVALSGPLLGVGYPW
jgi:hypothetical protein